MAYGVQHKRKEEAGRNCMIKKRLVGLLSHAKKYIIYQVVWQWLALLCQILMIYCASVLLEQALFWEVTLRTGVSYGVLVLIAMAFRFICDRRVSHASYRASVDVKRILRDKIYSKLLRLGAAYREKTATSEVVQMAAEGVEQLETYFGKYLSQLFYSLLAPVTLFVLLSFINWKASLVLLICVPLIPVSIVAVQKIAKRLLNKYWGIYTELGDSFLENLQGLTTLKIYRSDEKKAEEMDEESQRFRRITMKVLTMQLNSTSVMDIIAYGGAAVGMIVTLSENDSDSFRIYERIFKRPRSADADSAGSGILYSPAGAGRDNSVPSGGEETGRDEKAFPAAGRDAERAEPAGSLPEICDKSGDPAVLLCHALSDDRSEAGGERGSYRDACGNHRHDGLFRPCNCLCQSVQ